MKISESILKPIKLEISKNIKTRVMSTHNPKSVGAVNEARKSPWRIRVYPPQAKLLLESQEIADSYFFAKIGYIKNIGHLMGTNLYKKVFGKP